MSSVVRPSRYCGVVRHPHQTFRLTRTAPHPAAARAGARSPGFTHGLYSANSFVYYVVNSYNSQLLPSTLRYTFTAITNIITTLGYTQFTNPDAFGAMLEAWLNWSSSPTHPSHPCDLRSRHYVSGRSVEEIFELDAASSRPAAAAKRLAVDMPLSATRT